MFLLPLGQAVLFAAFTLSASAADVLPAAPVPQGHVAVPATRPPTAEAVDRRRWSVIVEPDEKIPALTKREKLLLPLHETFRWTTPLALLASAEAGVLRDNNPHFGVNGAGFGERVGAAGLRLASNSVFSDGLLPILFHDDPRYFRKAYGGYRARGLYAFSRVFVDQRDNGGRGLNFSDILGRGFTSALTQTYYPQASIGPEVVFTSWGTSLGQLAGVNGFYEFWPDIKRKLFHRSQ